MNIEGISAMLPLKALIKPVRLNMRAWRCRADIWNKLVSEAVEDEARRRAGIDGAEEMISFSGLTALNTSCTQTPKPSLA